MKKHCGRFSLILRAGVLLFSAAVCLGKLDADPITLDNNPSVDPGGQSYVSVGATYAGGSEADVDSLPYLTPISVQNTFSNSTLTNNLTTSGLNFSFSQVVGTGGGTPDGTDGACSILFQAGSGTTFSISGSLTLTADNEVESGANLLAELYDVTQEVYVYSYVGSVNAPGSLALDSSGGSLSGSLTSGDVYVFTDQEAFDGDGPTSLTGNIGINFTQSAPEPSTDARSDTPTMPPWALAALALLLVASASKYLPQPASA